MNATRCAPTTSAALLVVACLALALSGCKDAETVTGVPPPVPLDLNGTWTGTIVNFCDSRETVQIELDHDGNAVRGLLVTSCGTRQLRGTVSVTGTGLFLEMFKNAGMLAQKVGFLYGTASPTKIHVAGTCFLDLTR